MDCECTCVCVHVCMCDVEGWGVEKKGFSSFVTLSFLADARETTLNRMEGVPWFQRHADF